MPTRIKVALNFPRNARDVPAYARHIAAFMTGNPYFPSPTLPLATLLAHTAELQAAEIVVGTGAHGAAALRNAKVLVVKNDLLQLRTYVETVAGQHAEDAAAVVVSSGMSVKRSAGPRKAAFAVKQGKISGSVRLSVRHPGIVTSFDWQYSVDGTHWTFAPSNVKAYQDIKGLTPGTRYSFRYRTLTRDGTSDWSDVLTLVVV